ncbi:MAG: hypothetical protein IB616_05020 [Methanosarcinales archaeon]|nr:MAG: hypothetical protein IB616_05020 [Methanosarcinales archaeon]
MVTSNIVKFGMEERAITLKNQRLSHREIAKILARELEHRIYHQNVSSYFRTHYQILMKLAEEDEKFHKEVLRQYLDANAQLILDVNVVETTMGTRRRWVTTPTHYFSALLFAYVGLQQVKKEDWMNIRSRMNRPG